jgi:hypothetical protein
MRERTWQRSSLTNKDLSAVVLIQQITIANMQHLADFATACGRARTPAPYLSHPIIILLLWAIRTEEDQLAAWPVAARLVRHLTSFAAGGGLTASLIFVLSFSSVDGTGVLHHSTGAALLSS